MIIYDKLVRDKITNIIESQGRKAKFHYASDEEYEKYLIKKLKEECDEFMTDNSIEEMADVIEVVETLKRLERFKDVEIVREEKKEKRGGFDKRIILEETN